jgi:hypothetical protein
MKKCIFISEKCFCTVFLRIFRGYIFDCTCALADQSLYAGIVYTNIIVSAQVGLARGKVDLVYVHDVPRAVTRAM